MVPRLSTTVDLAPLLLVGWQVVFPVTELPYLSSLILLVAVVAVARLVAREIRPKAPRVLILGSGPMAWKLIEEIEAPDRPRYASPASSTTSSRIADSADAARWLGTVRPARRDRRSACSRPASSSPWPTAATGCRCSRCSSRACAASSSRTRSSSTSG